ncbi:hypothetical protein MNEG_14315 [Monoraphidium neglectum]|uniref:Uncharacterized protein n=1 Tax=Monoraphidium neglectum TaxID=145388 RepID=A0A0D2J0V6_9CHLO|nr:hypothetical protein MNEG_14315 [Monoraphidium neglectum]KIY93647.1 hypothetical protein MNEG_14315 [Monoraphidium neglectum]|eukprot:XP_013892667.1 hypothetical protein MNEG_14315 [Monoraphidium neglectum]
MTATLEKAARLAHRIGQLKDTGKVTSLLGVWQQRLSHQQARQVQQRQRRQEVWERQQQLLQQHQRRQQAEREELLPGLAGPAQAQAAGPPALF